MGWSTQTTVIPRLASAMALISPTTPAPITHTSARMVSSGAAVSWFADMRSPLLERGMLADARQLNAAVLVDIVGLLFGT